MVQSQTRSPRILLVAATTGYQIRMFGEAVERLGGELVFATDRCHQLDDPWRDGAVPIRFYDEKAAVRAIVESTDNRPIDGVVAVGDRPAVIGALAARALALPFHSPDSARAAANKLMTRVRLQTAGLPELWFRSVPLDVDSAALAAAVTYPCVIKPLALAASRGVMRINTPADLEVGVARLVQLLRAPDVGELRDPANETILIEEYVAGSEVAVEGLVTHGKFRVLAMFEKPDRLEGPYFEESIYVTPPRLSEFEQQRVIRHVDFAVQALGLTYGPVHAECRLGDRGVVVLEVGARPIGGLCSKVLRFDGPSGVLSLEELLMRHALSQSVADRRLVAGAAAVMMMPVPAAGVFRGLSGIDAAHAVPLVEDVVVTAKADQRFVPWPEGSSYPGFIFARGQEPSEVISAVRESYAALTFKIDRDIPITAETRQ